MMILRDSDERTLHDAREVLRKADTLLGNIYDDMTRALWQPQLENPVATIVRMPFELEAAIDGTDMCRVYFNDVDITDILPGDVYAQCERAAVERREERILEQRGLLNNEEAYHADE
jgi:hypothetical protein